MTKAESIAPEYNNVCRTEVRHEMWNESHYERIQPVYKHSVRYNHTGIYSAFFENDEAAKECFDQLQQCIRARGSVEDNEVSGGSHKQSNIAVGRVLTVYQISRWVGFSQSIKYRGG